MVRHGCIEFVFQTTGIFVFVGFDKAGVCKLISKAFPLRILFADAAINDGSFKRVILNLDILVRCVINC